MTSALVASLRPLMPMSAPGSGDDSLASTQHATDRFPRFTHLLRTGTPKPELKEGLVRPQRRSADPGEHPPASLATIPDPLAQRGTGDATCFRPCIASGSGTLGPSLQQSSSPSRASTPTSSAGLLWCPPASEAASAPKLFSDSASLDMASNSAANTSRGSAGTQRLPMPTRRGTDANAGERIIPGTPLSTSPQSQASSDFADAGADADELEQDDVQGGAQTGEGQPKKKKTRRAGVAITRHRKMQREVRRLAEEEDEATIQRQQPQRSLLHNVQRRPSLSPSPSGGPSMSFHSPSQYAPNPQVRSVTSPIPSTLSTTRPMPDVRHTRSEPFPAPQPGSRAPAGYDHTLEDGDDVVVWRPSTGMGGSSNIWAMRPDERPRGGSS
ncbi:hypothetical protein PYCCODRAFT_1431222 [Trametes coccinea BRFM310]|uniref:Uncharacterized protein n=1 Tax=Trametes coccinea (strain BRFM310) TaxID=1353009 RepID=A0A1Y2J4B8_TRAC3|nr:hypothetical protein PYCCODRAFT_1431222 [Trametes coccinea BRFM310]